MNSSCIGRRKSVVEFLLFTMTGLAFVVLFLLFPVNLNNKVNMRQPYPGNIAFFLWGLLLAHIELLRTAGKGRLPAQAPL